MLTVLSLYISSQGKQYSIPTGAYLYTSRAKGRWAGSMGFSYLYRDCRLLACGYDALILNMSG